LAEEQNIFGRTSPPSDQHEEKSSPFLNSSCFLIMDQKQKNEIYGKSNLEIIG
jgi:hypothetical protein